MKTPVEQTIGLHNLQYMGSSIVDLIIGLKPCKAARFMHFNFL